MNCFPRDQSLSVNCLSTLSSKSENWSFCVVVLTSTGEKWRKMRAARAARSFFITDLWRLSDDEDDYGNATKQEYDWLKKEK